MNNSTICAHVEYDWDTIDGVKFWVCGVAALGIYDLFN